MDEIKKQGSYKNIWYGVGRQRIEIPKSVLETNILDNPLLNGLYIVTIGFYPKATGHFTKRENGLDENFLFYCVDGHGFYELDGEKYNVGPNEYFILPQNVAHSYGSVSQDPWSIYWVHFGGIKLPYFNAMPTVKEHFTPHFAKDSEKIITLFDKMYKTLELGYSLDNLLFLNLCLSQYLSLFLYSSRHHPMEVNTNPDPVDTAILFMQENVKDMLTLEDVSRYSNYSVSRFSNLFKQKTGYPPMEYFMLMKIQRACHQLDFTNNSVKEIALNLGFADPYYFSKRFKQIIGMPPTIYRHQNKD